MLREIRVHTLRAEAGVLSAERALKEVSRTVRDALEEGPA